MRHNKIMSNDKQIEYAEDFESKKREREIQLLINVIEPDPEYQPFYISDEATFFDVTVQDESLTKSRLEFYLKGELPAPLLTPLWKFVDLIKKRYPEWPEEWPVEN